MEEFHDRILVYSKEIPRAERLKKWIEETYHPLQVEVRLVFRLEDTLKTLGDYFNGIVVDALHHSKSEIIQECSQIRYGYQGRLLLLEESQEEDSDEWGWLAKVSACKKSMEEIAHYLHRKACKVKKRGRMAIVCSGGGILGGYYEVGCLKVLSDIGISDQFDIYVGTSAGSFVLSCLVNKISPEQMIFEQGMGWFHYYNLNREEYLKKMTHFLMTPSRKFLSLLAHSFSRQGKEGDSDYFFRFSRMLPSAMLDPSKIAQYLEETILRAKGTLRFDKLRERGKELYITAIDIDRSKTVVFGDPGEPTSIPEAVEASIAIPGIYRSKEIAGRYCADGVIKKNADLDTAIKKGADLVFVIHPLVPYTGGEPGFIHRLGPFAYWEQSYRTILTKSLEDSINLHKYSSPRVTVMKICPDSKDPSNFQNVLSASPDKIRDNIERGYRDTLRLLKLNSDFLTRAFQNHGHGEVNFAECLQKLESPSSLLTNV